MAKKYRAARVGEEKISGTMKIYPPPPPPPSKIKWSAPKLMKLDKMFTVKRRIIIYKTDIRFIRAE